MFWRTSQKHVEMSSQGPCAFFYSNANLPSLFCTSRSFLHVFYDSATKAPLLISVWQHLEAFYTLQDKYPRQMMCRQLEMCKILISKILCQTALVPWKKPPQHKISRPTNVLAAHNGAAFLLLHNAGAPFCHAFFSPDKWLAKTKAEVMFGWSISLIV